MAAGSGLKCMSVLMLVAEILMRYHQQLPEDEAYVSKQGGRETGKLVGRQS